MNHIEKSKIKILLVSPYSLVSVGGIGTWTKSVLDYAQNDSECEIIFMNTAFKIKRRLKGNHPKLRRLFFGSIDSMWHIIYMIYFLVKYSPDVVHSTSSASKGLMRDAVSALIVEKIFKKHFVIHWHFGRIPEMAQQKTKEYKMLCKVHRQSSASISLDRYSQEAMEKDGLKNVYTVPNALTQVITDYASSIDIQTVQQKRRSGEVLFVGHIIEAKGVRELVEACRDVPEVKTLRMIGVCTDEYKAQLEAIAKERDGGAWLVFMGELKREAVLDYYKYASVFCLPSYTEGFPYVIMEAMSCACPVIATSVGAIPDILDNGCGVVIPPKNVLALSVAIKNTLLNKEQADTIGVAAYRKVLNAYTIDIVYEQYKQVWRNVL